MLYEAELEHDDLIMDVLQGRERIVSYPSTSQFNARGISACGLAAMNFASVLLELVHNQGQGRAFDVLRAIVSRETIEDIISVCSEWSSELHLDVEDIQRVPPFDKSLNHLSTHHGVPNPRYFTRTLQGMQSFASSTAVIITRPPEIITCAKITTESGLDIFAIFDSHPRPSYPSGAGLILNTSVDRTVARLMSILPAIDEQFLPQGDLQWQAQLLSNVASRLFVFNGPPEAQGVRRSVIASGLAVLKLEAEMVELKHENGRLISENKALERRIGHLEDALSVEKSKVTSLETSSKKVQSGQPVSARFSNVITGPLSHLFHRQRSSRQSQSTASSPSISNDDYFANGWKTDEALALEFQMQQAFEDLQREKALASLLGSTTSASTPAAASTATTSTAAASTATASTATASTATASTATASTATATATSASTSTSTATASAATSSTPSPAVTAAPITTPPSNPISPSTSTSNSNSNSNFYNFLCNFSCAICMEEQPIDNSVELDCDHPLCRECVRGHICSKIDEHRFPVFCPVCMAERSVQPGVISDFLVQIIGVNEKQYAIWEEMGLSQHSVLIHCRQCQRSVSVDKEEHEQSELLVCPLPDCNYIWCKACQQPITDGEVTHSCDGSAELDALMKKQGWKYCPSCKTPVERSEGCRHMTCISTGCNTHFCYACGGLIIRSALTTEIQNAVTTHYNGSTCRMFDDPNGDDDDDDEDEEGEGPALPEPGE